MATATTAYNSNTFIPSHEATNSLVIDFSRNPDEFALASWAQYVPVEKTEGRYLEMTVEMAGRILNVNLADLVWPDDADAPTGQGNLDPHNFLTYATTRYAAPFRIGELAAQQASWDIIASNARRSAQRLMTARTQLMLTKAVAAANWASAHTSDVVSIAGVTGQWDVSTTARMDIKRSLDHAADQILKSTLGAVNPSDIMLVLSPECARNISVTQEIVATLITSYDARRFLSEQIGPVNQYGVPSVLFGYPVVIEKTVKVTTPKGATATKTYILDKDTPFMCSRVGGLEGVEGSPSFSTFTAFLKEEMTVESKDDRDNRRILGRAVDNVDTRITASSSGFLFTDAIS